MLRTDTITGTDSAGIPTTVTIERDLPAPDEQTWPPAPVIGATVNHKDFGHLALGGRDYGARFCRVFSYEGDGILPWGHDRRKVPAGTAEFHSFKDWPSDEAVAGAVTDLLDNMPPALVEGPPLLPELAPYDPDGYAIADSDGFSFLLTYFHEGEQDFAVAGIPPREWRRRHRLLYRLIRTHRHGHRVGYMTIQNNIWTESKSMADKPKGDGDPFAWWAGVGDYAGWDAYLSSITNKPAAPGLYRHPAAFLDTGLRLAHGTGRRLFLPELGVIRQGAAPVDDGTLRADWMRRTIAYCAEVGVAGVAWWDSLGANSRDFRLTDPASAAAWRDAIEGRLEAPAARR